MNINDFTIKQENKRFILYQGQKPIGSHGTMNEAQTHLRNMITGLFPPPADPLSSPNSTCVNDQLLHLLRKMSITELETHMEIFNEMGLRVPNALIFTLDEKKRAESDRLLLALLKEKGEIK